MELYLNFNPFPSLTTDRLVLRPITVDDVEDFFFFRSDPDMLKYIDRLPMLDIKEAEAFVARIINQVANNETILWVMAFKENPSRMIGNITYWRIEKEHLRAEIGYMLHKEFWGRGIASEAMKEVIRYGFDVMNLHSIEANINPGNAASATLLKRFGFEKEGYFRESFYFDGRFLDSEIYSLINKSH